MTRAKLRNFTTLTRTLITVFATSALLAIPVMAVADTISQLDTINATSPFTELPVINYVPPNDFVEENLVMTAVSRKDVTPALEDFAMNAGLNDAWFNPITDGQGFFITVFPEINKVNLAWFTYDTSLPPKDVSAALGSPGHRWLTALGDIEGDTAVLDITIASGGLFDTATDVQDVQNTDDGTITLSFSDCNSGIIEYDIPSIDRQGSVPIERIANDNIALCEALLGE